MCKDENDNDWLGPRKTKGINWDGLIKEFQHAFNHANSESNQSIINKIILLTKLTENDIKVLFPQNADIEKLLELLKIIKSDKERNVKINLIKENIETLSPTILSLLEKLI